MAEFPDAGELAQALGQMLFSAGRPGEAAEALATAARLLPGEAAVQHDLGAALHEAGRPAEAIAAYRAAVALAPGRVESWHNLGSSLQATGDLAAALLAYGRAYRLDPGSFARIAQELAAGNPGRVWLRAADLRAALRA
jgi:Flp pilus assembly protein TadD